MADHVLSTRVTLNDGGAITVGGVSGTVPTPTAEEIANAQAAIDAMTTDIDSFLTAGVMVYLVPQSFFNARGWTSSGTQAWGYTPTAGKAFVNNGLSLRNQRYTVIHEIFHTVDSSKGVMNGAKRATIAGLMTPSVNTGVVGYWGNGSSPVRPSEVFADTAPAAYAGLFSLSYYTRKIPSSSYAAYRTAIGGASAPAATTLAAAVLGGATNIKVASVAGLAAGDWIEVGGAESHEVVTVGTAGSGGTGITLATPMVLGYSSGATVVETSAPSDVTSDLVDLTVTANTANGASRSHTFTGLAPGSAGTARMRFWDGSSWSPWSDSISVALPGEVRIGNLTVQPGTLTPDFGVTLITDTDNLYIWKYQIRVAQQTAAGEVVRWNTGDGAMTELPPTSPLKRFVIGYGGDALSFDQTYTVRWIVWASPVGATGWFAAGGDDGNGNDYADIYGVYPPPVTTTFTPTLDTGPLVTYGGAAVDLSFKIDTRTPTFRLADRGGNNIDQARLRVWNAAGTAILYDSGVVSFTSAAYRDIAVPANILSYGQNIQVDGAVRVTGGTTLGNFNEQKSNAHLNAQPGAPSPLSVNSNDAQVVRRGDGVWVTTTAQPVLVFPYRDTDRDLGYTDDPTRREIELRNLADAHVGASPYVITTGITDEWQIPASILALETTYKARARYDDGANVRSAFSEYLSVRYSAAPTLTAVSPADGATVTDPTPTFVGTFTGAGGKLMTGERLVIEQAGSVIYDSGVVAVDAPDLSVPRGVLDTAQAYDYVFYAYDSDGLFGTASGSFTTVLAAPDPLTGLVVTPDVDTKALVASWTASVDAAFEEYRVYVRTPGRQFRLVATITDPDEVEVFIYSAAHNSETIVRVTQFNGWGESEPIEESATLGGDGSGDEGGGGPHIPGYWLVRPGAAIELLNAKSHSGDTKSDLELFSPPGRVDASVGIRDTVVLNWGATGYEGSISIFTDDRELIRTLRTWKRDGVVSIFKTWYGAVRYVRLTATPDSDQPHGWINGDITYIEIAPVPLELFNIASAL